MTDLASWSVESRRRRGTDVEVDAKNGRASVLSSLEEQDLSKTERESDRRSNAGARGTRLSRAVCCDLRPVSACRRRRVFYRTG